jgi:hypothetical protein
MKIDTTNRFANVARMLAKDEPPPEWLVPILRRFSRLIGYRKITNRDEIEVKQMLAAAKELEKLLPIYVDVEEQFGFQNPDCIETVLIALPELIEYLENQLQPGRKGGPIPDSRRRLCASVCAEVWRRQCGEVQPFSPKLWEACEEYWQTCGNPETSTEGRLKNWEPYLKWVKQADDEEFREHFQHLITQSK